MGFSGEVSPKTSLEGSTYFCHSSEGSISMRTGVTMLIGVPLVNVMVVVMTVITVVMMMVVMVNVMMVVTMMVVVVTVNGDGGGDR